MKGADMMEGEEEQREGFVLKRIQEIRERGARFQQRKGETRHLLLETAEATDIGQGGHPAAVIFVQSIFFLRCS